MPAMNAREARPVAAVVGEAVRGCRESGSLSADDLAARLSLDYGLPWSRATVGALERGERELTLSEFAVLLLALRAKPLDLLPDDVAVLLTDPKHSDDGGTVAQSQALRGLLAGKGGRPEIATPAGRRLGKRFSRKRERTRAIAMAAQLAPEQKAARKLGVSPAELSQAAFDLWERGLTDEREHRLAGRAAGADGVTHAARGHVTRQLIAELEAHLGATDNQATTDSSGEK